MLSATRGKTIATEMLVKNPMMRKEYFKVFARGEGYELLRIRSSYAISSVGSNNDESMALDKFQDSFRALKHCGDYPSANSKFYCSGGALYRGALNDFD
mmetsp:Transcript_13439/g.24102  ORF Transcript_13439/g.24102 Transcript_13439/m.24102 type:complete len:99 (-) Transcript_13439:320-616(-)